MPTQLNIDPHVDREVRGEPSLITTSNTTKDPHRDPVTAAKTLANNLPSSQISAINTIECVNENYSPDVVPTITQDAHRSSLLSTLALVNDLPSSHNNASNQTKDLSKDSFATAVPCTPHDTHNVMRDSPPSNASCARRVPACLCKQKDSKGTQKLSSVHPSIDA